MRLSDEARAQLIELAALYSSQTAAMEAAVDRLHRWHFPDRYPDKQSSIVGWVRGRTSDGREGWLPKLSDGTILDEVDEDVD